ncbi:hypothetical protein ACUNWD_07840 [Sunxiuqinia sp. A32]|uniref:hypothetical protein n=1 Tax=Sunxiuqinia sp. A32 TaxID=3461496 RepID=UPI00404564D6
MKNALLILCFIFFSATTGVAQSPNGIIVKNYKNQKTKFIEEGSKITVKKYGQIFKGTFQLASNEAILVNSDTILISEVQELYSKTAGSNIGGIASTAVGGWAGAGGIIGTAAVLSEGSYAIILIPFTAAIGALGTFGAIKGIQLLSRGKKYKSVKWEYTLKYDKIPK